MDKRIKWFDRKFNFEYPVETAPYMVERLRGTPVLLEEKIKGIADDVLEKKIEGQWSIKEHVGHLTDLEELHIGRLDDFADNLTELRPADLTNAKTHNANHNSRSAAELTGEFRKIREKLLQKLETMSFADLEKTALHPRLKTPMRVLDMLIFTAEHDTHHLALINQIIKETSK